MIVTQVCGWSEMNARTESDIASKVISEQIRGTTDIELVNCLQFGNPVNAQILGNDNRCFLSNSNRGVVCVGSYIAWNNAHISKANITSSALWRRQV